MFTPFPARALPAAFAPTCAPFNPAPISIAAPRSFATLLYSPLAVSAPIWPNQVVAPIGPGTNIAIFFVVLKIFCPALSIALVTGFAPF